MKRVLCWSIYVISLWYTDPGKELDGVAALIDAGCLGGGGEGEERRQVGDRDLAGRRVRHAGKRTRSLTNGLLLYITVFKRCKLVN